MIVAICFVVFIGLGDTSLLYYAAKLSDLVQVATKSDPPGSAGDVSMYTIDASTGALTSIGMTAAGTDPVSVAVDPGGKFAYVANSVSNNVSMYAINATTGDLTSTGTIAAGTNPVSVAVDRTSKFVYVANSVSNDIQGQHRSLTPIRPRLFRGRFRLGGPEHFPKGIENVGGGTHPLYECDSFSVHSRV